MRVVNALLRLLAVGLLILVILLAPLSLLLRDLGALLFDPATIKALVEENLLEQGFMVDVASQTVQSMLQAGADEAGGDGEEGFGIVVRKGMAELDENDWAQLTNLIVPPALVAQTADAIIDGYVQWLDNDEPLPSITLDLSPWKGNISQNARQIVAIVMDALPECTADEMAQQALEGLEGGEGIEGAIPVCRPPEPLYSTVLDNADGMAAGLAHGAPDQLDLSSLPIQNAEQLLLLKVRLNQARLLTRWTWLLVFGLGALAVLMAARSWPAALNWSGWPLLLIGLATLILGLLLVWFAPDFLQRLLLRMPNEGPAFLPILAGGVGGGILLLVGRPLLVQGLIITFLGIAALVGAYVLERRAARPVTAPISPHPVETTPVRRVEREKRNEIGD